MSDDEIRVAIAEKLNWVRKESPRGVWYWYEQGGKFFPAGAKPAYKLPDFPNDLNACHEFEKSLTAVQWNLYTHFIEVVTRGDIVSWLPGWMDINPSRLIDACLVHSTARQRCEAFLCVHGLWKDNPTPERSENRE